MRTPLNSVIGLLSSMEKFISHPKGIQIFKIIQTSSSLLQYLVNDMLDLFQIKNGKFNKNEKLIDIRDSIKQLLDMFMIST